MYICMYVINLLSSKNGMVVISSSVSQVWHDYCDAVRHQFIAQATLALYYFYWDTISIYVKLNSAQ